MSEIIERLGHPERNRIARLRQAGCFFWLDLSLTHSTRDDLAKFLEIPEHALRTLLDFGSGTRPSRRFHADGQEVVFAFTCYVETQDGLTDRSFKLRPVEVAVLVCGDYLLTVHREAIALCSVVPPFSSAGRSEQYAVYAVLDGLVSTIFDALTEVEEVLERLEAINLRASRVRVSTLREISSGLSDIRRRVGPQRGTFERVSEEITHVDGLTADSERYFERIHQQMNRSINEVDAAANAVAQLISLRLNETMYWLTVVATIFLPLTFIAGFYGMNFGWMVGGIDSPLAFFVLGIGSSVFAAALMVWLIRRRGTPIESDEETRDGPGS